MSRSRCRIGLCAAVLAGCLAVVSPAAAAVSGRMSWGPPREVVPGGLLDVTCPSASLCLALSGDSYMLMSADPGGGADAWKLVHFAPGLTPTPNGPSISGVSCPSARLCVATDNTNVLVTTDPATGGAAWRAETADTVPMSAISCPSVSLCVAVDIDQDVVTSTDPTGGAATWTSANVDHAVGPECGKYEPGEDCILGFEGIACPTASLCVAVDGEDNIVTSTDPTGGASAWNVGNPDPDDEEDVFGLNGVSCPSASFCMTVTEGGVVLSSRNPADGASSWSSSKPADLGWASCPFVTFCVGGTYDQSPVGVFSQNPTGGAAAWRTVIDRQGGINAVACPTRSFCVAVDSQGDVLTGSPTPTAAKLRRLLDGVLSHGDRALLEHGGYRFEFDAPSAGRLTERWLLGRRVPVASLAADFPSPGRYTLELRVSRRGRRALKRAGGGQALNVVGSLTAAEGPTVTVDRPG